MLIEATALQSSLCIVTCDVTWEKHMSQYEIISAMMTELLAQYGHTC
jgi:hypothetical protein